MKLPQIVCFQITSHVLFRPTKIVWAILNQIAYRMFDYSVALEIKALSFHEKFHFMKTHNEVRGTVNTNSSLLLFCPVGTFSHHFE